LLTPRKARTTKFQISSASTIKAIDLMKITNSCPLPPKAVMSQKMPSCPKHYKHIKNLKPSPLLKHHPNLIEKASMFPVFPSLATRI
jgi:hypothetical protein